MRTSIESRGVQVFLLALAVLMFEVALTRIFSFIMFCHFTYLVISVAMLGFGAAGTYLTVRKSRFDGDQTFVARHAAAFGVAAIAAVVVIPRIRFYPMDMFMQGDYSQLVALLMVVLVAGLPFFLAGTCIGFIVSRAGASVSRVYAADLVGAALGCVAAIAALSWLGGTAACCAVGALGLLVAALANAWRRLWHVSGFVAAVLLTILVATTDCLPLYAPPDKPMFREEPEIEYTRWHPVARVDVTTPRREFHSFGGALSHACTGNPPETRLVYQDGGALTGIIKPTGELAQMEVLGQYLQGAPYRVAREANALVIGSGGGVDVLIALHHGARHVVGVDINPYMIDILHGRFAEFAGGVFQRPDVELVVSEGRHFLTRDARQFDVIQLSGVDTYTALAAGAYALTEYYVYTREAFDQYLAHLTPDGIVNISRPMMTPPQETLRLALTGLDALAALGAERPAEHLVVLAGKGQGTLHPIPWAQTMVKRSPFTRSEVSALVRWTRSLGFDVVYEPFTPRTNKLTEFIQAPPTARAALLADYPMDVRPVTDNRPFFFQFYRYRDLWSGLLKPRSIPVAVTLVLVSLLQVVLLSAAFILFPLWRQRPAARRGGRFGVLAYFAALGLGFMLIEIAILQKFTVFLGGPAYSMAVTLCALLFWSGLGSRLSGRWAENPRRLVATVVPLLAAAVLVASLLYDRMIEPLLGLSHVARGLIVAAAVAPLGLLMGMPFPSGLRIVDRYRAELAPWAWGINACASVVGGVVCMLISAALGFSEAMQIGAAVYVIGWLIFRTAQRSLAPPAAPAA